MRTSTLIALADKLGKMAKPLKKTMTPGCHPVEETIVLRVGGKIDKSYDTEETPTTKIPLLATLAIFIEKSGVVGDSIAKMLQESMTEALLYAGERDIDIDDFLSDDEKVPDKTAKELIEARLKDVDAAMERVRNLVGELPKTPKSGATRCDTWFEVLALRPPKLNDDTSEAA